MATYTVERQLIDEVNEVRKVHGISIAELAMELGRSRSMISQYLSGKYKSKSDGLENELKNWVENVRAGRRGQTEDEDTAATPMLPEKLAILPSQDYTSITGVCDVCQHNAARGLIVGKSGYGKSFALQNYAKMPRVVYIECNENMNAKDLVRKIERAIGMPKVQGTIDERMDYIINYFNVNQGYLLLVDEADKLISKYTQKKIEMLRYITDRAQVGVVMAGEPALESAIRTYDTRFANRMDFYYKLGGLSREELKKYFAGFSIEESAMRELELRAMSSGYGCFRLLDRTLNNILRLLREQGKANITLQVIREASGMMML